jgi:Ca2+-binding EF-hand superfamily protein
MSERKTSRSRTATTAAFVLLLSACVASHSQERRDPAQLFEAADTNGDGVVTRGEFLAARAANFAKYDRNGDGFIDPQDFPRRMRATKQIGARLDELIVHFDTDGDGRINHAEFVDGPTSAFDLADTSRDGQLTADEIAAAASALKDRRAGGRD